MARLARPSRFLQVSQAASPMPVLSLAAGTALLVICAWLFGGWQRGSLVASLLVILFFSFGHVRLALPGSGIGGQVWPLCGSVWPSQGSRSLDGASGISAMGLEP